MLSGAPAGLLVVGAVAVARPEARPSIVAAVDVVEWIAVAAAALALLLAKRARERSLLRRAGLAFVVIGVGHTVALPAEAAGVTGLAGMAMLLAAALAFLVQAIGIVGRQQARLAEAEAAMASAAERDHEIRNLVAGLSGVASVLTGDTSRATSPVGQQLLVAARAEFERLQLMMGARPAPADGCLVAEVVHAVVALHKANGLDVEVGRLDDVEVEMSRAALTQVLTNLLVNCSRHAQGAHVSVAAVRRGQRVRLEVRDDGPGLPGPAAGLLVRGARGADSDGLGLGLAIIGDLVQRHGGTFTISSVRPGCTAVVDVPLARRGSSRPVRVCG